MKKRLLFSCLVLACTSVQATPISLEYQGFYNRLKQVNKGHYPLVELTFSVPNKKLCRINSGTITTEKESFPLTITSDQRLFLPYDDRLKSDRALINLDIEGKVEHCNISMQVRAKQTRQIYQKSEILQIQTEMDALLNEMQGFPMRYFAADIAGINFVFEPDSKVSIKIDGTEQLVTGMLRLSRAQIAALDTLELSVKPKVISPWTNG
ncbi:DUF2987 domain-containing protein [Shewanella sp. D64]|uniref:DUF2987 domain-containing protein n=1 Tax=unclassified Shewanella TaxID=196818 RepID=UPI0022BA5C09|nr:MULTISPECIES: DUF2987 domain-containing protein [unclassified Shewanella]MEC4724025.1 DUF2987 domain-containing protein [Shewanella sp. D64]MEC4736045.1 DUF2987 domain-containing protein [Shewanella sp. E94]WBJ98010.1 DUF2987 domain-containing protein [Shewanella sp. MTB7]